MKIKSGPGIPLQVFLSYDRSDEKFAMALSGQLDKHGLTIWREPPTCCPDRIEAGCRQVLVI